jgi:hypothetical protein
MKKHPATKDAAKINFGLPSLAQSDCVNNVEKIDDRASGKFVSEVRTHEARKVVRS